jgi:endonuclease YncB( thermonuclease family)
MGCLFSQNICCKKKRKTIDSHKVEPKSNQLEKNRGLNIINSDYNFDNVDNDNNDDQLSEYQKGVLMNATYKGTLPFTIKNVKGWAKAVKVYDGDTTHIAFYHKEELVRLKCRVIKIDTAEMRSANPKEKEHAYKARDRFTKLCSNKLVWVHIQKEDLYGRFLTAFYTDETEQVALHQVLLDENLAYPYNGGKKIPFDEWYKP